MNKSKYYEQKINPTYRVIFKEEFRTTQSKAFEDPR